MPGLVDASYGQGETFTGGVGITGVGHGDGLASTGPVPGSGGTL